MASGVIFTLMLLSDFISHLLSTGKVTVQTSPGITGREDTDAAKKILLTYYEEDKLEMPYAAPAYHADAAVWAAEYIYRAVQLTVWRDAGEEMIARYLEPYGGDINPSAIYSADLMLRYLPQLFELAKGLAPGDKLVEEMRKTALQWPFSSVGMELNEPVDDDMIFTDQSLAYMYTDRVIREKDKQRIKKAIVANHVQEIAGSHLSVYWPGFEKS